MDIFFLLLPTLLITGQYLFSDLRERAQEQAQLAAIRSACKA